MSFDSDGNVISCIGQPLIPFNPDKFEVPGQADNPSTFLIAQDAFKVTDNLESFRYFTAVAENEPALIALEPYLDQLDAVISEVVAFAGENICHTR